jgi:hypothetical protein
MSKIGVPFPAKGWYILHTIQQGDNFSFQAVGPLQTRADAESGGQMAMPGMTKNISMVQVIDADGSIDPATLAQLYPPPGAVNA